MKIVLIGPTYPFRGGISHYTTLLCKALRTKHDVKFISFSRQYPKILFPGRSDRDTSKSPVKIDNVDYIIDSMNPITWLKAVRVIKEYQPDKIVIQWWVAFWTPHFYTILKLVKLSLSVEIVFICHNVFEHEPNFIKKKATKIILSKADLIITHSRNETWSLKSYLAENVRVITAFLPTFAALSDKRIKKEEAKKKLGLSGNVLLFFGFVRDYKGLDILLDAMPMILKNRKATLLVAGEFWKAKKKYLDKIKYLEISSSIRIIDEYIPNEEIAGYFAAADLVIQPYISVSGSAICQLAYGFDRPVIATNIGCLSEVIEDRVNGRLVEPGDAPGLASAILESLEPLNLNIYSLNAKKSKKKFSWEKMADIVAG